MSGLPPETPAEAGIAASHGSTRECTLIGMSAVPTVLLSLYSEKRLGLGEDAEPLAEHLADGECVAVGAFDGLGGSGATQLETPAGQRTSAHVAARLVRRISRRVVEQVAADTRVRGKHAGGDWGLWLRDRMAERLRAELAEYLEKHGATTSKVRSNLLRPLPTTLAMAVVRSGGPDALDVEVLWAGDSRVYLLSPEAGLQQLTTDDLVNGADPMQNLSNESRMSNLVSADGRFHISVRRYTHAGPAVVIAATDGCFGYVRTPAEFEGMLFSSLRAAEADGSWDTWRETLREEIVRTTGDDATLAMACIGWRSLPELARAFDARGRIVGQLMDTLTHAQTELARARSALAAATSALDDTASRLWDEYRDTYEGLLPRPEPAPEADTADTDTDDHNNDAEPDTRSDVHHDGTAADDTDRDTTDNTLAVASATGVLMDRHAVSEPSPTPLEHGA